MAKIKMKTKDCQMTVKVILSFKENLNEMHLDYISEKNIYGLMKVSSHKKNRVFYSGPVGISLYDRLKKPVSKFDFFFIVEQVADITRRVTSNLMMLENVLWDIHNVYINEVTKELQFIYLPLDKIKPGNNASELLEQIIYSSKPDGGSNSDYVSKFVYFLRSLTKFDADRIEEYVLREDRNIVATIKSHGAGQAAYHRNDFDDEATGLLGSEDEATGLLNYEDEATGLLQADEDATGLLVEHEAPSVTASMTRVLTGEIFVIGKPVFRIGKESKTSDYTVSNNEKVSRNHAEIIRRSNCFYIVDSDSKNGTFVNGTQIRPHQETEIRDGDVIRFANEEFKFFL
jgi:hypothetical protein